MSFEDDHGEFSDMMFCMMWMMFMIYFVMWRLIVGYVFIRYKHMESVFVCLEDEHGPTFVHPISHEVYAITVFLLILLIFFIHILLLLLLLLMIMLFCLWDI